MAKALYANAPHLFLFVPKLKLRPANGRNNNCAVNTVEHNLQSGGKSGGKANLRVSRVDGVKSKGSMVNP